MQREDGALIRVNRDWDSWQTADVRFADLQNVRWLQPDGAPRALVHGYVFCTDLLTGSIPHDCDRTPKPHRLLVCILKSHTAPSVYLELVRRADVSDRTPPNEEPHGHPRAHSSGTARLHGGAA